MIKFYAKKAALFSFITVFFILISTTEIFPATKSKKENGGAVSKIDLKILKGEISRHTKEGRRYYNLKKYNLAVYEWQLALSLDPENKTVKKYITDAKNRLEKLTKREMPFISVTMPFKSGKQALSVDDCVNIAVKNSPQLKIAEKQIKLSRSRLWEARRNMFPKLTIAWEESGGRISGRRYYGRKEYIEGSHTIYKGGELYSTMKQAEINLEVEKTTYEKTKNELILQVRKSFYSLAKSKENLRLQTELAKEVDAILDMVAKAFDAGVTTKIEFLNASSQQSQVQYQLASAKGDESVANLVLKQSMNLDLREEIGIEPALEFKKLDVDFETTLHMAYMNRPEMKINSLTLEYYRYEKRIARAKDLPKVDLMGSYGLAKELFVAEDNMPTEDSTGVISYNPYRKLEDQWYAGAKVQVPFWGSTGELQVTKEEWPPVVSAFHGTESVTKTAKITLLDKMGNFSENISAEIDLARAIQEYDKLKQDIAIEVKEGCYNYEKALLQIATASNKIKYQERDLELTRFKRGMDEVQDSAVIESMIKNVQERFGYVQALADYHIAMAGLNKAIGIKDYFKVGEAETREIR